MIFHIWGKSGHGDCSTYGTRRWGTTIIVRYSNTRDLVPEGTAVVPVLVCIILYTPDSEFFTQPASVILGSGLPGILTDSAKPEDSSGFGNAERSRFFEVREGICEMRLRMIEI